MLERVDTLPDAGIERFGAVGEDVAVSVAIPAKDEEERLPACLSALASQTDVDFERLAVTVLLNNCRDGSLDMLRGLGPGLPFRLEVVSQELPAPRAHAGWARRLAMQHAASMTRSTGVMLTTDADSVADGDWIAANLSAFEAGADAVAGFVTADWTELSRLPDDVLRQGADEWDYQTLAAELEARADPVAHDPFPRHNQNCGASTAIRADLYRAIGGLPPEPVGEDRALFDAVRARDGRIRHSLAAHVTASARTVGRASGGMADALATRGSAVYECDEILEPAMLTLRRNRWRHEARAAWGDGRLEGWLQAKGIDPAVIAGDDRRFFWPLWRAIEQADDRLAPRRMKSDELPRELRRIRKLLAACRAAQPDGFSSSCP